MVRASVMTHMNEIVDLNVVLVVCGLRSGLA